jgi:cytochrome c oxidase assembly protein subunit 15
MHNHTSDRWLHRLAWLTAATALVLPIATGSVVTTVDAGMAFADWLTSDGHFMLVYPWLKSTGDKFIEHGHRLAGVTIGLVTLALAAYTFAASRRRDVQIVVGAILVGVIAQGVLGGQRVIQDERVLALVHGDFAACVFSLMGLLVAMTGRVWTEPQLAGDSSRSRTVLVCAIVTFVLLALQYVLGGMLRHLGSSHAWLVHPWFAIVVVVAGIAFFVAAQRTGSPVLSRAATWVIALVVLQTLLGVATWGVRYGFPQWDIVAVQQSPVQIAIRSLHKVTGLVTFMAAFVAVVRCARIVLREKVSWTLGSVPDTSAVAFAGGRS